MELEAHWLYGKEYVPGVAVNTCENDSLLGHKTIIKMDFLEEDVNINNAYY